MSPSTEFLCKFFLSELKSAISQRKIQMMLQAWPIGEQTFRDVMLEAIDRDHMREWSRAWVFDAF